MRIRVTEPVRIKVKGGKVVSLDAHHEYYLEDDKTAANLVKEGRAVELDAHGRVIKRPARTPAASKAPEGTPGKPGATRTTKAETGAPENKDSGAKSTTKGG
ncbi:hypothetical protein Q7689_00780 [Nocardiopsis tropica]|uniref:hypothetical protein n=1 Tax=Nocardiopsis tropica TaxID=109330 RepID=UPI002E86022F|nr:hypothetical protein [Nocardiopsis tropica]